RAARLSPAPAGRGRDARRDPARSVRLRLRSRHERDRCPPHAPPQEAHRLPGPDRDRARRRHPPGRGGRAVTATPATLGAGLGRSLALATVLGMITFGVAMALMIYFTEVGETCDAAGEIEDPPLEIVLQTSLAFAFALPFGVTFSIL